MRHSTSLTNPSVERNSGHFMSLVMLGCMGAFASDDQLVEMACARLRTFDPETLRSLDPEHHVAHFLARMARLRGEEGGERQTAWQAAIFTDPSSPQLWKVLAEESRDGGVARVALRLAMHQHITSEALAQTHDQMGRVSDLQRSVMLAPWRAQPWQRLALVHTKTPGRVGD